MSRVCFIPLWASPPWRKITLEYSAPPQGPTGEMPARRHFEAGGWL